MDLSNITTEQEAQVMELLHPVTGEVIRDDKDKAFTITLLGSDTNSYKAEFNAVLKEVRAQKKDQTERESEKRGATMLAKITTDCYLIMDSKKMKYSVEAMADLYFNPEYTWIREQVEAFTRNRANFIKS